jgi:hypothetical protein
MTRLELENLVADWLNDPSKTYFTASTIQTRLNLAQRVLQSILIDAYQDFYTTCATTVTAVGRGRYKLPGDFRKVRRLEILMSGSGDTGDYRKLEPMDLNQQDLIQKGTGTPTNYFILKNHLYLRTVPDSVKEMHLHYIYRVQDIANDGDSPDIPEDYHEFLAILAVRADLIKDGADMNPILNLKEEYEKRIRTDAAEVKADGARMIVATRGGYGAL